MRRFLCDYDFKMKLWGHHILHQPLIGVQTFKYSQYSQKFSMNLGWWMVFVYIYIVNRFNICLHVAISARQPSSMQSLCLKQYLDSVNLIQHNISPHLVHSLLFKPNTSITIIIWERQHRHISTNHPPLWTHAICIGFFHQIWSQWLFDNLLAIYSYFNYANIALSSWIKWNISWKQNQQVKFGVSCTLSKCWFLSAIVGNCIVAD